MLRYKIDESSALSYVGKPKVQSRGILTVRAQSSLQAQSLGLFLGGTVGDETLLSGICSWNQDSTSLADELLEVEDVVEEH
jgi:hypothetical protein